MIRSTPQDYEFNKKLVGHCESAGRPSTDAGVRKTKLNQLVYRVGARCNGCDLTIITESRVSNDDAKKRLLKAWRKLTAKAKK